VQHANIQRLNLQERKSNKQGKDTQHDSNSQ